MRGVKTIIALHIGPEPVSKLPELDFAGCKLYEAGIFLVVSFPSAEESTLPQYPGTEAFHQSAALTTT